MAVSISLALFGNVELEYASYDQEYDGYAT